MRAERCLIGGFVLVLTMAPATPVHSQPWVQAERADRLQGEGRLAEAAAEYGQLVQDNPFNGYAWSQWGFCLHGLKRYEEAIKGFTRAVELGHGRPGNLYNAACANALLGRKDAALDLLRQALEARFAEQQTLENDSDMDSLRSDLRFAEMTGLIGGLREPPAATRDDGWRWDLDFCLRRMKQMHWDLYAKVSQETLRRELETLKADVPSLGDDQVRARLRRITALVGDGHTASRLLAEGEARRTLPVHMFLFKEGLYVIGAAPAQADLVGARVVRIGGLEAAAAVSAVRPYASVDNEMGHAAQAPVLLTILPLLEAIGAATGDSGIELVAEGRDGSPLSMRLEPVDNPNADTFCVPGWTYLHESLQEERPLYLREREMVNWMVPLPEQKAVYFHFGAVADPGDQTFSEFVAGLFQLVDSSQAEHLVIDMRFNGGGNTGLVRPLVDGLIKRDAVNRRGHLWVIIGRDTFSAAQNTVNLLDKMTQAVFVGEPTGSRPQFVGESTWFLLPHSRTRVFCSSRYWQIMDSTDERSWVPPEILAEPTFASYAGSTDPAMDAIVAQMRAGMTPPG